MPDFDHNNPFIEMDVWRSLPVKQTKPLQLMVTMWPTFKHFNSFANDPRVAGVRLNTAMIGVPELDETFKQAIHASKAPLYFDIKGKQLRVTGVYPYKTHLELELNHPIKVSTPVTVMFKAGEDSCLLKEIKGNRLIFDGGPKWMVNEGESIHIRDTSLVVEGPTFLPSEIEKLEVARKSGFTRYFLSYVESQQDVDCFRELVGQDAEVVLKIENLAGLKYAANDFIKDDKTWLMAAMGDLYVEVERPHHIINALKAIIKADPNAGAGSRMMLSVAAGPVPSSADFMQLAWLREIGYHKLMLCDEICLREDFLDSAVTAVNAFRSGL